MTVPPLVADGIGVRIGAVQILDDISHRFAPGRVTALLGANGAGKSTLLDCIAGLRQPTNGRAMLGDMPVNEMERSARGRAIGFLPQTADVHWDIDVETLVGLGRFPHAKGWGVTQADRAAIAGAMAQTDVSRFAGRLVNSLSGGERSRVLLARVLAGQPRWLLADEPLASLDPAHRLDVLALLRATADAGTGVIVVVHDLGQALRLADDVLLLKNGVTVAAGPCDSVLTAANIARAYGVEVQIGRSDSGVPFIVPLQRTPQ
jgi:iron complex transport system ATP-binding protein